MHFTARLSLLALAALLTACAGTPPAPEPVYTPFPIVGNETADDVVMSAIGLVDTPYRYGGNTPDSGFDCSGLIGYVYRNSAGIQLPRSTREMIGLRAPNVGREALQSGDLVFFATNGGSQVSHAGIYVGEGRFVHAPSSGGTVRLDSLSTAYWQKSYLSAKRVLRPAQLAHQP
ncbi:C40 family peptidase [Pseudomonas sp. PDM14]|uniref:C40 family peptidase n=1 Tax=Pseudomonas sp. PDM14 TaxID=2769288 RepID=UPI00177DF97B|nr:C40 family peptidase [Pseudomonas sp. PDM14]MBD9481885.1 C40 family peptidase [Pseudomonas sp. PDM14]